MFYISAFGFGHMTRSLAIIEAIIRQPDIKFTIKCTPQHMLFAEKYLERYSGKVYFEPFSASFNIIFNQQQMAIDVARTKLDIIRWAESLNSSAADEIKQLNSQYSLVLSDIVPEAFVVAKSLQIPGIGISNFTWYEICRGLLGKEELKPLRAMYEQASVLFEYDLSTGEELPIKSRIPAGLAARPFNDEKIGAIRRRYKSAGRPLLFFSIGGAMNLDRLSLCPECDYLYTRGIAIPPSSNAYQLAGDVLDTHNYLAACDGVITKCGWSTVAEGLIARKPLFVLKSASGWVEEKYILQNLRAKKVITEIEADQVDKLSGDFYINGLRLAGNYDLAPELYNNNAAEIAAKVLAYL